MKHRPMIPFTGKHPVITGRNVPIVGQGRNNLAVDNPKAPGAHLLVLPPHPDFPAGQIQLRLKINGKQCVIAEPPSPLGGHYNTLIIAGLFEKAAEEFRKLAETQKAETADRAVEQMKKLSDAPAVEQTNVPQSETTVPQQPEQ